MTHRTRSIAMVVGGAILLCLATLLLLSSTPTSTAAPFTAPTPVTISASTDKAAGVLSPVYFCNKTRVVTSVRCGKINTLASYATLDLQYIVTFPATTENTVTLKLQFSNNGIDWVDGPAIATDAVTTSTDLNQYENFGLFTAIYATVATTNPVTITTIAVAK